MLEVTFGVLEGVVKASINRLFFKYVDGVTEGPMRRYRADSAKRKAITQVLTSLEPMFHSEIPEDHEKLLVNEIQLLFEKVDLTAQLFAEHKYELSSVVDYCLNSRKISADIQGLKLDGLYINIIKQICNALMAIAPILPDWESSNWRENFRAFSELSNKLSDQSSLLQSLNDEPKNRLSTFEKAYCKYIIDDLSQIKMQGVGCVSDVEPLSLDKAFVPLTLTRKEEKNANPNYSVSHSGENRSKQGSSENRGIVHVSTSDLLNQSRFSVIVGAPGSGKTTIARHFALHCARGNHITDQKNLIIPFILSVRSIKDFDDLPVPKDFISICAPMLVNHESERFSVDILNEGRALIIIDGLDECEVPTIEFMRDSSANSKPSEWEKLIKWLEKLTTTFKQNRFIVTSRPVAYMHGMLKSNDYVEYEIQPLSSDQRKKFVYSWCESIESNSSGLEPEVAKVRAQTQAADLLRRIKNAKSISILASTPLMLSVICIVHRYKGQRLPERRVELLGECVDVLLYEWRRSQGISESIIGDLDARKLRGLLEPLAYYMAKNGKTNVEREEVFSLFEEYLPELGEPGDRANEVLSIVKERTGVLLEVSPGIYTFAHLIIRDYLAAEECARIGGDIILQHANDSSWKEIIAMAVAASKGNRETLIRGLLQKGEASIAGKAIIGLERISNELRIEVISSLKQKATSSERTNENSVLLEMGGVDAAKSYFHILTHLPVVSSSDLYRQAVKRKYADDIVSLTSLGEKQAERCLLSYNLDLGSDWEGYRDIGYTSDTYTELGGMWRGLSVSLKLPDDNLSDTKSSPLISDPIYEYAVVLDTAHSIQPKHAIQGVSELFNDESVTGEEKIVILMVLLQCCYANDIAENLLHEIKNISIDICPSAQLGFINCLNKNAQENELEDYEKFRDTSLELWNSRLVAFNEKCNQLIRDWTKADSSIWKENVNDSDEAINIYSKAFTEKLDSVSPLSF